MSTECFPCTLHADSERGYNLPATCLIRPGIRSHNQGCWTGDNVNIEGDRRGRNLLDFVGDEGGQVEVFFVALEDDKGCSQSFGLCS